MNRFVVLLILSLFASCLSLAGMAHAETNSIHYQWLETGDQRQSDFIQNHNAAIDSFEKNDPNFASIEFWLFELYNVPKTLQRTDLDSTHSVILRENGLGKSTDLVLDTPEGETVLYSDNESGNPPTTNLVRFGVSPDKSKAFLVVEQKGSIDPMQVLLIDLGTQTVLNKQLTTAENSIAWISSSTLAYTSIDEQNQRSMSEYDLNSDQTTLIPNGALEIDGFRYVTYFDGKNQFLHDKIDQSNTAIICRSVQKIVAEDDQGALLFCMGDKNMGELRRFDKTPSGLTSVQLGSALVAQSDKPIRGVTRQRDSFFVTVRNGPDRWVRIYDNNGSLSAEIPVPDGCSFNSLVWDIPGQSLVASMSSAIGTGTNFVYTLASASWNRDPNTVLMGSDGIQYKSEVSFVQSADGTAVPLRLTYRADLVKDGSHPVYFESYGGFAESGYLDPHYKPEYEEFLKRGGILAAAGIRGGNEYGPSWHSSAIKDQKIHSYQDLKAAAEKLVQDGWTIPQKIISTGTSNGGLTVAATALLYPADFGLIIPISGVVDFLGKERLDTRDQGWDAEYGNANDPLMLPSMTAISPLENAKNLDSLHFLILDGLDDTRVNHAHSLKLQAALEEQGGNAGWSMLASFQDAGHWLADFSYQNSIAWHANALVWTAIFKQAGWQW